MRKVNLRLFLILIVSVVVLAPSVWLAHYLQTGRIARALLWQADYAEQEERPEQTVKYLSRYLEFVPHDTEQRVRLGRTLAGDKLTRTRRAREQALYVLQQVLNREPDHPDLLLMHARLAMELKRLDDAKEDLDKLEQVLPQDGEVHQLLGKWHEAKQENGEALKCYTRAVGCNPKQVESYERLAALLGAQHEDERAGQVMDDLVRANDRAFRAYLIRGRYREDQGLLDEAAEDVARARELAADEADVILASAHLAEVEDDFDQARDSLQRGFTLHPKDARLYQSLAELEMKADRRAEAIACLQNGVKNLTGADQVEVIWDLGNMLVEETDWNKTRALANATIAQLAEARTVPIATDYLRARVHLREGEWAKAAKFLEQARVVWEAMPDTTEEYRKELHRLLGIVDLLLGECYVQLNDPPRQLAAYTRAVARDPGSVPARLGLASAQETLGKSAEALEQYRQLARVPGAVATGWIEIARLQLRLNQGREEEERDWREAEEALRQAQQAQPNSAEVLLLTAQLFIERNDFAHAQEVLEKARGLYPKNAEFWTALADVAQRRKEPQKALQLLDEAERQSGDTVALRVARARYWAAQRTPEAAAALDQLAVGLDRFTGDDMGRLLYGLAEASFQMGRLKEAGQLWTRLAEQPRYQNDLRLHLLLFDLALKAEDEPAMQRVLQQIRRVEGGPETMWRYGEAVRFIYLAKHGKPELLDPARTLLDQVAVQKPTWPAVLLAKAEIENLKGDNPGLAIANYRRAIELGERSPRVVRQLVELLRRLQRYDEAEQEMRRLPGQLKSSADLRRLAADISLRNQDPARAVELALEAVTDDSRDYHDYLWLGQVLAVSGRQPKQAEEKLRRAVEFGESVGETWVSLVQLQATMNLRDAEATIERARAKLPPDEAALALAQCYEAVNRTDQAGEQYQAVLAKKPDDVAVLRAVTGFYLRTSRYADAESLLRQVLNGKVKAAKDDTDWARRNLAMTLASGDGGRRLPEALDLLGLRLESTGQVSKLPGSDESAEELRARAQVLATQQHRLMRTRAIALLEELKRRQALTAADQFLLAQLYEAEDNAWPKAREQLRDLVTAQPKNNAFLAHYAEALLRQHELDEAQRCIDRLEQLEKARQVAPGALGSTLLRCLALEARGEGDKAFALLKQHVERKDARPEDLLLLIAQLGRRQRVAEALDLCERAWETCPADMVAGTCVAVLRAGPRPSDAQCARVADHLHKALDKDPKATLLLANLADLEDLRGRYAEVEAVYRRILAVEPRNVLALNNLAWMLAQRSGNGNEALELIGRAMEVAGPRPELLDTRAVVYLALKRSDLAIQDLARANQETPSSHHYFHLARAHLMANNSEEAVRAFQKAKDLKLKRDQLHPVEQVAWSEIADKLDRR